jgi:hypothetical protein
MNKPLVKNLVEISESITQGHTSGERCDDQVKKKVSKVANRRRGWAPARQRRET